MITACCSCDPTFAAAGSHHSGRFENSRLGSAARSLIGWRVTHFLEAPEHEDGGPPIPVGDVFDLHADSRVLTHPGDLLADCRERVQALAPGIERVMDGNDVGLVLAGAAQPREIAPLENGFALRHAQLVNAHGSAKYSAAAAALRGIVPTAAGIVRSRRCAGPASDQYSGSKAGARTVAQVSRVCPT